MPLPVLERPRFARELPYHRDPFRRSGGGDSIGPLVCREGRSPRSVRGSIASHTSIIRRCPSPVGPAKHINAYSSFLRSEARSDPATLLFGKARGRVLAWLYARPDERFYLRQLVGLTGVAQGAVQREVHLLTHAGLITRRAEGRQVYYQANRESPIFSDLQQLLVKTFGAAEVIRRALGRIEQRVDVAFIYGSAAKGTSRAASDIDLMVVGTPSFSDMVGALTPAQAELGREINPTVFPRNEFIQKVRIGNHFVHSVLRGPKVFVIGTENDIDRLGKVRVADGSRNKPGRDRGSSRRRRA